MRFVTATCGAIALVLCVSAGASADEWNKRTYLTFSGPVQIPGATLPAGTYTFELANPDTTRHVIRISEKDSGKPIAMFITIPQDRLDPPNDNLIMFAERPAGAPQAIQAWFYPGDRIGEEFVYPKSQAMQIAKANRVGVLATEGGGVTNIGDARGASIGRVDENGRMADDTRTATTTSTTPDTATTAQAGAQARAGQTAQPTTAERPQPTTAERAQPTTAPRAQTAEPARPSTTPSTTASRAQRPAPTGTSGTTAQDNTAGRRNRLPRTASNLVALELLSGLALISGLAVRRIRVARATR